MFQVTIHAANVNELKVKMQHALRDLMSEPADLPVNAPVAEPTVVKEKVKSEPKKPAKKAAKKVAKKSAKADEEVSEIHPASLSEGSDSDVGKVTLDDVNTKVRILITGNKDQVLAVRNLLKKHGAANTRELKPEQYAEVAAACDALLAKAKKGA